MKKHFLLIASLLLLTGCPEPVIQLSNIDGDRTFLLHGSDGLEFSIEEATINKFANIRIPIKVENYKSFPVKLQFDKVNVHFENADISCDFKCISSIAFSHRDLSEETRPMQWRHVGFKEPPSADLLNIEIKPNQLSIIYLVILIPDEHEIGNRRLKRVKKSLENEIIDVFLGQLILSEESILLENFSLLPYGY